MHHRPELSYESSKPAPITGSPRFVSSPLAGAVLGGPIFLLVGLYCLLLSFDLAPGDDLNPWIGVPLGLLFFLPGGYAEVAPCTWPGRRHAAENTWKTSCTVTSPRGKGPRSGPHLVSLPRRGGE